MIKSIYVSATGAITRNTSPELLRRGLAEPNSLTWVSLERPDAAEYRAWLDELFHFHPLAIEDCQSTVYQPPKVDDFGTYIFMIIHAAHPNDDYSSLDTDELDFFLGANFLVTVHQQPAMASVNFVWEQLAKDERLLKNGPDFLCHAILDKLVDDYMPILDKMDADIEWLEDQVLEKPRPETLHLILKLKHSVMALRRIVAPQREIINRLSRDDFPQIDRQSRIYFRDIYDHLVRIQDLSESVRDIVSGAMDIYLNSTSLRLNNIMKALTIVSTIFLPLSFVAGVYGMNFSSNLPDFSWPGGIFFFWAICLAISVGMLAYFKKQGWF